jgi:hypothetical protein
MRRTNGLSAFLLFALAAVSTAAPAQAKPNFSGEWKLNVSRSDFGPLPVPVSRTDKIKHEEPALKVTTTQASQQGEGTFELNYTTDGKESVNEIRGNSMKSTSKWDGDTLVIETKANFNGNDLMLSDKWSLSADGKVLTINRHIASPMGELDQKVVLEKQ